MRIARNKTRFIDAACAAALSIIAVPMAANAAIVDFEDINMGGLGVISGPSQASGGFSFSQTATGDDIEVINSSCGFNCVMNGTNILGVYNGPNQLGPFEVLMTRTNGGTFNLVSFEFGSEFTFVPSPETRLFTVIGTTSDGATVTQNFMYDSIPDNLQFTLVSGNFTNLESVLFHSDRLFPAIDNINVSGVPEVATVPIPPAAWLLGSGLLGMVGVARRRNA